MYKGSPTQHVSNITFYLGWMEGGGGGGGGGGQIPIRYLGRGVGLADPPPKKLMQGVEFEQKIFMHEHSGK